MKEQRASRYRDWHPNSVRSEEADQKKNERIQTQIRALIDVLGDPVVDPNRKARIRFNLIMNADSLNPVPLQDLIDKVVSLPTSKPARVWLARWQNPQRRPYESDYAHHRNLQK